MKRAFHLCEFSREFASLVDFSAFSYKAYIERMYLVREFFENVASYLT